VLLARREGYDLYYAVWCTNKHELYDHTVDPWQLDNLLLSTQATTASLLGYSVLKVASRLDALLLVLKSCKADSCVKP
jgi:hypothetical protein